MFLMLFVHVSFFVHSFQAESLNDTKACLQDPTQPFCVDYHLDKTIIEESLIMICGPKGMMPDMSACTIWRICGRYTSVPSVLTISQKTVPIPMNRLACTVSLSLCTNRFVARCGEVTWVRFFPFDH